MKVLLQRVSAARVEAEGDTTGEIGRGLLVFLGVEKSDSPETADRMGEKILKFRIFEDPAGRMNRSITDVSGGILVVSQFTLCADTEKGNRPSFDPAAPPEAARAVYQQLVQSLKKSGLTVETGSFGAKMSVHLINEGPATFLIEAS